MTRSQRADARRRNHAHRPGELTARQRAELALGLAGFLFFLLLVVIAAPIIGGPTQ